MPGTTRCCRALPAHGELSPGKEVERKSKRVDTKQNHCLGEPGATCCWQEMPVKEEVQRGSPKTYPEMEEWLINWMNEKQQQGQNVCIEDLRCKAREFAKTAGIYDFTDSSSWASDLMSRPAVVPKLESDPLPEESCVDQCEPPMSLKTSRPTRVAYSASRKLSICKVAEEKSNRAAARQFGIDESVIRRWRTQKLDLQKAPAEKKRVRKGMKNQTANKVEQNKSSLQKKLHKSKGMDWPEMEDQLAIWIVNEHIQGHKISAKAIRRKAKELVNLESNEVFSANAYWMYNFMKRHGLSFSELKTNPRADDKQQSRQHVNKKLSQRSSQSKRQKIPARDEEMKRKAEKWKQIEEKLILWLEDECRQRHRMTGSTIRSKAKDFIKSVGMQDRSLSATWTTCFLKRHGLSMSKLNKDALRDSHPNDKHTELEKDYTRRAFPNSFKLSVCKEAESFGNRAVARKFGIGESIIRRWRARLPELQDLPGEKKAMRGSKPKWPKLEEQLVIWIADMQQKGHHISANALRIKSSDLAKLDGIQDFASSESWLCKFLKRHKLSIADINLKCSPNANGSEIPLACAKGKQNKRRAYPASFKLSVCKEAEAKGNRAAARQFGISESIIRRWRERLPELQDLPGEKKARRGNNPKWPNLEEQLVIWIAEMRQKGHGISSRSLQSKARDLAKVAGIQDFVGHPSWMTGFLKRHGITLHKLISKPQSEDANVEEDMRLVFKDDVCDGDFEGF